MLGKFPGVYLDLPWKENCNNSGLDLLTPSTRQIPPTAPGPLRYIEDDVSLLSLSPSNQHNHQIVRQLLPIIFYCKYQFHLFINPFLLIKGKIFCFTFHFEEPEWRSLDYTVDVCPPPPTFCSFLRQ